MEALVHLTNKKQCLLRPAARQPDAQLSDLLALERRQMK